LELAVLELTEARLQLGELHHLVRFALQLAGLLMGVLAG
jgi:hypothetical protein